jgi:hypothetical protein
MTEYFRIEGSINPRIIGPDYPQCQDYLKSYNDELSNKRSVYSFAFFHGKRADITPDLNSIVAREKAVMTDLLSCSMTFGADMVFSTRLLETIQLFRASEFQVFEATIHKKKISHTNYRWIHFVYGLEPFIDFKKSCFYYPDPIVQEKANDIRDYEGLQKFRLIQEKHWFLTAREMHLSCAPFDFFVVGDVDQNVFVSKRLKNAIETSGFTGVEFFEAPYVSFASKEA